MAGNKILCVAEKPSIAKAVANHLGGGAVTTRDAPGLKYNKNYEFMFDFGGSWGGCAVVMTSVLGHLTETDFGPEYKSWSFPPPENLFGARIYTSVAKDKTAIAKNIETQARYCKGLFIWTDCDREGEHIGEEVRQQAVKGNPRIEVKRAQFSNIERAHVLNAARSPVLLDALAASAVQSRIELDLRIGAAFTRLQCLNLQRMGGPLEKLVISYGSCQFPTLGFVVDRYFKVQNFVPETFWSIKLSHNKDNQPVNFLWDRSRLFDRAATVILFERCIQAKYAKVTKVNQKQTKKWRPLPLTTVELQKMASRFLRMNSATAMKVAEDLYNKGFISYPRTETDIFDRGMDLKGLCAKYTQDNRWGDFASRLVNSPPNDGGFNWPRSGKHDDKAHPPIHPIAPYNVPDRSSDEGRLYEFIVRRFLACCSSDAVGSLTTVNLAYGPLHTPEGFHASGLTILARNYLDVYPYENWTGNIIPAFIEGEMFEPTSAKVEDGKTTSPGYLTEPDLIALMDANGIGTDATMAEHIAKIKDRAYVETRVRGGGLARAAGLLARGRGSRGGRGGRGSRGGRGGGRGGAQGGEAPNSGVEEFIPTNLGVALIEGYDKVGFEENLSKPFLRKELEIRLKGICEGRETKEDVLRQEVARYKRCFEQTQERMAVFKREVSRYVFGQGGTPVVGG